MAGSNEGGKPTENIFRIMDEIVYQLNKSKKMFIWMIISIVVLVPVTHILTSALLGDSFRDGGFARDGFGPPDGPAFRIWQFIIAGVVIAWIVIGIRQWFILSKWTKRYRQYKELQKKVDEKLDYDEDKDKAGTEPS